MLATKAIWSKSEFEWRWKRAHELMLKKGFDALLITNPINVCWFTGAEPAWGGSLEATNVWFRRSVAIVPKNDEPILLHTSKEAVGGITNLPVVHALKGVVGDKGTIGTEMGPWYPMGITYNEFEAICKGLYNAKFYDASSLITQLHLVKSQRAIDACRRACKIADKAHGATPQIARIGIKARELADLLLDEIIRNDGFQPWVMVSGYSSFPERKKVGEHSTYGVRAYNRISSAHSTMLHHTIGGNETLREGNLFVDMGCSYNYYQSDFSRHYWLGEAPERAKRYAKISVKCIEHALSMTQPGVVVGDVFRAVCKYLKKLEGDYYERFRKDMMGHAIGMNLVDGLSVCPDNMTSLKEGMVLTYEPAFLGTKYGDWIPEVELAVTKDGYDLLSSYPVELQII